METKNVRNAVEETVEGRDEVLAVYFYGSTAEGNEHSKSDIDLALLMEETPEKMYELDIASKIYERLEEKMEVDVRILNKAGLRFTHQVLKNGKKIYLRDEEKVAAFEEDFYREYLDKKPLIKEHDKIRSKRMKV